MFGFDFQVNAAIVLMLENIEDLKSQRLEGNRGYRSDTSNVRGKK